MGTYRKSGSEHSLKASVQDVGDCWFLKAAYANHQKVHETAVCCYWPVSQCGIDRYYSLVQALQTSELRQITVTPITIKLTAYSD